MLSEFSQSFSSKKYKQNKKNAKYFYTDSSERCLMIFIIVNFDLFSQSFLRIYKGTLFQSLEQC